MTRKRQKRTPAIYTLDDTSSAHSLGWIVLAVVMAIVAERCAIAPYIPVSVTSLDVSCPSTPPSLCVFDHVPHIVSCVSHECLPHAFVPHAACFTACISLRMPTPGVSLCLHHILCTCFQPWFQVATLELFALLPGNSSPVVTARQLQVST